MFTKNFVFMFINNNIIKLLININTGVTLVARMKTSMPQIIFINHNTYALHISY